MKLFNHLDKLISNRIKKKKVFFFIKPISTMMMNKMKNDNLINLIMNHLQTELMKKN